MTDSVKPSRRRRTLARELLTPQSEYVLAEYYRGQIPAVVIERALLRMVKADLRAARKAQRDTGAQQ